MALVVMDGAFDGDEADCEATDDCANVTTNGREATECVQPANGGDSVIL